MAQTRGAWITDPSAYRKRLKDLVGGREPLEVLGASADTLAEIVRSHTPAQLRSRPMVGKWTANEVIGHLGDSELIYGFRIRLILSEDRPAIVGVDQEQWVAALGHRYLAAAAG
jgi:DinB family protein